MSSNAFHQLERDRLADEDYHEAVRIERLHAAGKLCNKCFATATDIRRNPNTNYWHCMNCGAWWAV
jgi:ribosomal protein L37AE/L43A